jgi:hypothetical protein
LKFGHLVSIAVSASTADILPDLLERIKERPKGLIIMDDDPERLVKKIVAALDKDLADVNAKDYAQHWFLEADDHASFDTGTHTG